MIIYPCTVRKKEVQEIMPQLGPILRTIYYSDVIMRAMASQITSLPIVYSTVYSSVDQRKQKSSALLAFVRGIHRWPVNSPHKRPVTRKRFPFDDVIMSIVIQIWWKFYSTLIQLVMKWSLWNFENVMLAVLSCHVQNFVAIWYTIMKLH